MSSRIRISVALITMAFVTIMALSCRRVHSLLLLPGKRAALRITTATRFSSTSTSSLSTASSSEISSVTSNDGTIISSDDRSFLSQALDHAKIGSGHTFPNPAVGCVIVRQDTGDVVGAGFHPRAGSPHAEVFALLEAAGHVKSGVDAAKSVLEAGSNVLENDEDLQKLIDEYAGTVDDVSGPQKLFADSFADVPITAYVTLEPCCHYGKTPPCAESLALAKVDRVVVGFRDPNPRVDGGGVKVLQDAGIDVAMANDKGCAGIVDAFVKRILPKDYDDQSYAHITGGHRRALRTIAGRKKTDNTLNQISWNAKGRTEKAKNEEATEGLVLPAEWMENLDAVLWRDELVNLRLNKAVQKKKLAKHLGERIAASLGAHVAQVIGHTVLLYRPGIPAVLDLDALAKSDDYDDDDDDDDNK
jgi:pyrimidine deaminase RibD-like protein/RNA-binding protein YhbY